MGNNTLPPTLAERRILASEGIDPDRLALPEELRELVAINADTIGRVAGLVVGDDFIRNGSTGDFYHLETNFLPGLQTYEACWPTGQTTGLEATRRAVGFAALDSIARWRTDSLAR